MNVSHMLMQWGQFLDHEVTLTPQLGEITTCDCCNKTDICLPIKVPPKDPTFGVGTIRNGTCIPFRRSVPACSNASEGTFDPRQQINDVSSYIDASVILGPDLATANSIRAFSGGRLRVGYILPGNTKPSLPVNMQRCYWLRSWRRTCQRTARPYDNPDIMDAGTQQDSR